MRVFVLVALVVFSGIFCGVCAGRLFEQPEDNQGGAAAIIYAGIIITVFFSIMLFTHGIKAGANPQLDRGQLAVIIAAFPSINGAGIIFIARTIDKNGKTKDVRFSDKEVNSCFLKLVVGDTVIRTNKVIRTNLGSIVKVSFPPSFLPAPKSNICCV